MAEPFRDHHRQRKRFYSHSARLVWRSRKHRGAWRCDVQQRAADITVGNGNNVTTLAEVSGTIDVGSGADTIHITDGNSIAWLGSGSDTVTIDAPVGSGAWAHDTLVGTSTVHSGTGDADITVDDTGSTPHTTLNFIRGETEGSTFAAADVVRYGHADSGNGLFVGGDLAPVAIDLSGYSAGSSATLTGAPPDDAMLLQIHDAATGSVDTLALHGAGPTSIASLDLRFT